MYRIIWTYRHSLSQLMVWVKPSLHAKVIFPTHYSNNYIYIYLSFYYFWKENAINCSFNCSEMHVLKVSYINWQHPLKSWSDPTVRIITWYFYSWTWAQIVSICGCDKEHFVLLSSVPMSCFQCALWSETLRACGWMYYVQYKCFPLWIWHFSIILFLVIWLSK